MIMGQQLYRVPEMNRYVRTAMLIAREECLYFRHLEIRPEHILLGLIQVPGSITETVLSEMDVTAQLTRKVMSEEIDTLKKVSDKSLAQKELSVWNIDLDKVLKGITDITTKAGKVAPMNYTPETSSASFELLSLAAELVLQQKASHICTDHVLLSLFSLPDWSIKVFLGSIGLWQARVQPTLELMRSDTQEFKDMNNANLH
jgi:ATP-dependent Clp protease ATP-binding subunit ClpA